MKKVELRLLAGYRRLLPDADRPGGVSFMDVDDTLSLEGLLAMAGIEADRPLVVLVNGRYAPRDKILDSGDVVSVFPPVAGG